MENETFAEVWDLVPGSPAGHTRFDVVEWRLPVRHREIVARQPKTSLVARQRAQNEPGHRAAALSNALIVVLLLVQKVFHGKGACSSNDRFANWAVDQVTENVSEAAST